jgi:hypothetical protein
LGLGFQREGRTKEEPIEINLKRLGDKSVGKMDPIALEA